MEAKAGLYNTTCPRSFTAVSLPKDALGDDEPYLPLGEDGVHPFTACVNGDDATREALADQFRPPDCWAMPWLMRVALGERATTGLFVDVGVNSA